MDSVSRRSRVRMSRGVSQWEKKKRVRYSPVSKGRCMTAKNRCDRRTISSQRQAGRRAANDLGWRVSAGTAWMYARRGAISSRRLPETEGISRRKDVDYGKDAVNGTRESYGAQNWAEISSIQRSPISRTAKARGKNKSNRKPLTEIKGLTPQAGCWRKIMICMPTNCVQQRRLGRGANRLVC